MSIFSSIGFDTIVSAVDPDYKKRSYCYEFSNGRRFFDDGKAPSGTDNYLVDGIGERIVDGDGEYIIIPG